VKNGDNSNHSTHQESLTIVPVLQYRDKPASSRAPGVRNNRAQTKLFLDIRRTASSFDHAKNLLSLINKMDFGKYSTNKQPPKGYLSETRIP
jgi:hypothetical protein